MKFSNIKFDTRSGGTTSLGLYVTCNNWVPKDRFFEMWEQAQKKLPLLDWSYPENHQGVLRTSGMEGNQAWPPHRLGALPALFR